MKRTIKEDVSGTAFLVNVSRTKMPEVSRDIYAHLWVTPEAVAMWNECAQETYPHDGLNLSLRNRFFLEHLKRFAAEHDDPVFVNIAAGFTNYPFLLETSCRFVEVDFPHIVAFKEKRVAELTKEGKLPSRKIHFVSADLNDGSQRAQLGRMLADLAGKRPSFAIMEGLTYYLQREVLDALFEMLAGIQQQGSLTAFDYWRPDSLEYPVMVRLKSYLCKRFGCDSARWNLFDESYIRAIEGFVEIESTTSAELELLYSKTRIFQNRENKVPVHLSVLKRTSPPEKATSPRSS